MKSKLRLLYFGTWGYGKAGLEGLLKSNNVEIIEVFTKWIPGQPDVYMDQVWDLAITNNLTCTNTHKDLFTLIDFNSAVLKHKQIDFILSCCYDRIFKPDILASPKIMPVNVHPSLLPKYRGIKPLENAIINNEKEIGITIHELEKELDSGRILYQNGGIKILPNLTYDELYKSQCELITQTVFDFFKSPELYIDHAIVQDKNNVSMAPRLPFLIDGNMTVNEIISVSKANI